MAPSWPFLVHLGSAIALGAGPRGVEAAATSLRRGRPPGSSFLAAHVAGHENYVFDGYSRVGCEVDAAPEAQRIHFKDHACGAVKSCRLLELPMEPRLCFDFCRKHASAKFFGIAHGRDCYCSPYFTPESTGGHGDCSFVCDGDTNELCGGPEKSSLFEMHMCGDSADEAALAQQLVSEATAAARTIIEASNATASKLRALALEWKLGVCSIEPEGVRACALSQEWVAAAATMEQAAGETAHIVSVAGQLSAGLVTASDAARGNAQDAALASRMELATRPARDVAAKVKSLTATLNLTIVAIAGPLVSDAPLASFGEVFQPLGEVANEWHAICALAPISGAAFATDGDDGTGPAKCATRCLSESVGTGACVAFNYQHGGGVASCQLLSAEGLVQPRINMAVPIFEVSRSKLDSMGFQRLGCYAHGAFMSGHPRGPLGTEVVREITV